MLKMSVIVFLTQLSLKSDKGSIFQEKAIVSDSQRYSCDSGFFSLVFASFLLFVVRHWPFFFFGYFLTLRKPNLWSN